MSEKFSLKWNDYHSNWNKALCKLRNDTEFADVTLISDDKVKFSAHKILLSSCSNLFKFILKGNIQSPFFLYLSGVNSLNLGFILDYIYYGEVSIFQEQLDSFLESAQNLEIEGLLSDIEGTFKNLNEGTILDQAPEEIIEQSHHDDDEQLERRSLVRMDRIRLRAPKDVAKIDVGFLNPGEIEERMRELYERTDDGWRCLVCDHTNKASKSSKIRMHVETHMDGLVFTCTL